MEQQTQELVERRRGEYNDRPKLQTFFYISIDGKWFVHKTVITDIKPINFMKKIILDD